MPLDPPVTPHGISDSPCQAWCTWEDVEKCTTHDLSGLDAGLQGDIIEWATTILWELSGRRYPGECEATRTLCSGCSCRQRPCCCLPVHRVDLGNRWPILDVSEVVLDGVVMDPADYTIIDWRWLARTDGDPWPRCVDVTDEDSFSVTFTYGRSVNAGGARAAAVFAAELALDCLGGECNLPSRISSVQREGVSYTLLDPQAFLAEGRTGVYLPDLWLAAEKAGRKAVPGMFDPAACGHRIATGATPGGS